MRARSKLVKSYHLEFCQSSTEQKLNFNVVLGKKIDE